MLHDLRRENRYPMSGEATLSAGEKILTCKVLDVSLQGISVCVEPGMDALLQTHRTWHCHVESSDLPAPIDCLVRVVRQRPARDGIGFGCEIAAIDEQPSILLKAYRSLAIARDTPMLWRKKLAVETS